ncbi:MAG: hypothetical protein IIB38_14220, partial [Candidatus Hydrogenedentes bacterium]|nr:hypothetical protein [Candidatus Hydrogenedentota bacterium]
MNFTITLIMYTSGRRFYNMHGLKVFSHLVRMPLGISGGHFCDDDRCWCTLGAALPLREKRCFPLVCKSECASIVRTIMPEDKKRVEPRTLKGFQDLLPEDVIHRKAIIRTIEGIFESYGFNPLETPALEHL